MHGGDRSDIRTADGASGGADEHLRRVRFALRLHRCVVASEVVVTEVPSQDEVFVEQYLQHEDNPEGKIIAARLAGFLDPNVPVRAMVEHHFNRPEIQAMIRIARKKAPPRAPGEPTPESIYADMDVVFEKALAVNNPAGAVAAVKLKAQVAGLLKENVIHTHRLDVTNLTDEQLTAIAQRKPKTIEAQYTDVTPAGLGALVGPEAAS